jgi:hypothetical protein
LYKVRTNYGLCGGNNPTVSPCPEVQVRYPEKSSTCFVQTPTFATEIKKRTASWQSVLIVVISYISIQPVAEEIRQNLQLARVL